MGVLGPQVAQQKAQVGLVGVGRGDAGIHIHVVVHGDIVIALGSLGHVPLAEDGVDKAVDEGTVIVVLLHDQVGVVKVIHPGGDVVGVAVGTLAADGIQQHGALDVGAAEKADGLLNAGGDPIGPPGLVHLKLRLGKHHGGVVEAQVAHHVAVQRLGEGVLHALAQPLDGGFLGHHVHHHIGGQTAGAVGKPLDKVGVADGGYPHRAALVVDLGGVVGVLELAHHIAEGAHLPVPQVFRGEAVQGGDLLKGDLSDLSGEVPGLGHQQLPVYLGPEDGGGEQLAHHIHHRQGDEQNENRQALALHKSQVFPKAAALLGLEPGSYQGGENIDHAQQKDKAIEVGGVEVEGGEGDIEVGKAKEQSHQQVDDDLSQPAFWHPEAPLCVVIQSDRSLCKIVGLL